MPTDLERAMETLIVVFHRYAGSEGNQVTLSRGEIKQLMETELASYLRSQKTPDSISQIMSGLDTNGDGEVSFAEFMSLVMNLSIACEQIYERQPMGQTKSNVKKQ